MSSSSHHERGPFPVNRWLESDSFFRKPAPNLLTSSMGPSVSEEASRRGPEEDDSPDTGESPHSQSDEYSGVPEAVELLDDFVVCLLGFPQIQKTSPDILSTRTHTMQEIEVIRISRDGSLNHKGLDFDP
jgi:hypothetical protein